MPITTMGASSSASSRRPISSASRADTSSGRRTRGRSGQHAGQAREVDWLQDEISDAGLVGLVDRSLVRVGADDDRSDLLSVSPHTLDELGPIQARETIVRDYESKSARERLWKGFLGTRRDPYDIPSQLQYLDDVLGEGNVVIDDERVATALTRGGG